jgi:CheY-like chemotaxis protein
MRDEIARILLIEDNDVDIESVRRALEKHEIQNPLIVARDGQAALEALRDGSVRRPFLVLLDLNLPRMNGLEFLHALRAGPELTDSVVFVLTTSRRDEDQTVAYRNHVAGYMVKSEVGESSKNLAALLTAYLRLVELPQARG